MQVTVALEELSRDYPIDIPPYFALILRAFSVIEGTALRVDPDYAIVSETFPYLSRRLLTDNQPRTRAALRQLLYGVRLSVIGLVICLNALWQDLAAAAYWQNLSLVSKLCTVNLLCCTLLSAICCSSLSSCKYAC